MSSDEQPDRLEGHINAAEYWLNQADIYNFPDPARTECLQLAAIHASLAQALAAAQRQQEPIQLIELRPKTVLAPRGGGTDERSGE